MKDTITELKEKWLNHYRSEFVELLEEMEEISSVLDKTSEGRPLIRLYKGSHSFASFVEDELWECYRDAADFLYNLRGYLSA